MRNKTFRFLVFFVSLGLIMTGCTLQVVETKQNPAYISSDSIRFIGNVGFTLPTETQPNLELRFDQIENNRPGGLSPTLRITVWATQSKYDEIGLNGYIIGTKALGQIATGNSLNNGKYFVPYFEPSEKDLFYITIALQQFEHGDIWSILDAVSIDNKLRSDGRFEIGQLTISGSKSHFTKSDLYSVVNKYEVGSLKVQHIRRSDSACAQGFEDHIQLDGPIGKDSTYVITKLLEGISPCVNNGVENPIYVYLNSSGGLLKDGYALGRLFRRIGVHVVIVNGQHCSSSCAVAFLGAKYRELQQGGKLLFHAPYTLAYANGSVVKILCSQPDQEEELQSYYVEMLGQESGLILYNRTISFCSSMDGWTINQDAAKLFGISNL